MNATLDYLAVAPCGCIRGWMSAEVVKLDPKHAADVVGQWIRAGDDVQRVTTQESRERPWRCPTHPKVKQETLALAGAPVSSAPPPPPPEPQLPPRRLERDGPFGTIDVGEGA